MRKSSAKEHREAYTIAHLLSSLAEEDNLLTFPLELIHRESPDFLLLVAGKGIGIEHVDVVSQDECKKEALTDEVCRELGVPHLTQFVRHAKPGKTERSPDVLKEEMKADESGHGWGDTDQYTEWINAMLWFIDDKKKDLLGEKFSRYDEDWLLIRDRWSALSLPGVNREEATRRLFKAIQDRNIKLDFHRVFILPSEFRDPVCEVAESGFHLHPRNDLWSQASTGQSG